jgi:GNAT superfamily N-acetyltransferase
MEKIKFEIKLAYNDTEDIKMLFAEYTDMLLEVEPNFQQYLNLQNYDDEIEDLCGKYGLPDGRLYIAYDGDAAAACIAIKKLSETSCEMKRLYVRPQYRGNGLAKTLVNLILNDAKRIGYKSMLLDTLPGLKSAITLYESLGFYKIPCYNNSPIATTIFMKLDLE